MGVVIIQVSKRSNSCYLSRTCSVSKIIWTISLILIGLSLYLLFLLYLTNRSLWYDEAALAFSLMQRNLGDLVRGAFLWDQNAPLIYIYIVKVIAEIFGYSEFTLRVFSLFAYILALFMAYKVMDRVFKLKYPIAGVAFLSNITILIYYANEFKPYMTDVLSVLSVLYLYYLYSEENLDAKLLFLVYAIFPWLSYPTIFFIGGVLSYEFIKSAMEKDMKKVINIAVGGLLIVSSFAIYYMVWLKPVDDNEHLAAFFLDYHFPLIPLSFGDLKKIFIIIKEFLSYMRYNMALVGILAACGFVLSLIRNTKYHMVVYIGIFLTLCASFMGKYPLHSRLMLFMYPILVIYIFTALDEIMADDKGAAGKLVSLGLMAALFFSNYGSLDYLKEENRYREGNETNPLIEYIDENIKEDEMLYVYNRAIPAYTFKMGQGNERIGKHVENDTKNVIFGAGSLADESKGIDKVDMADIKDLPKCYILISNEEGRTGKYLKELGKYGEVELIKEEYGTPLYYFRKIDSRK